MEEKSDNKKRRGRQEKTIMKRNRELLPMSWVSKGHKEQLNLFFI